MKTIKWKTGVLCALLAFSALTGCGETKEDVAGTVTPHGMNTESEAAVSTAAEEETTTQAADAEETESGTSQERKFSLGSEEGTVYENSYGGFGAAFGDGWKLYSAEELQDLSDDAYQLMEDSGFDVEGREGSEITDMKAENEDTMQSVNIVFTKMSVAEQAAYSACPEEELIDELLASTDWSSYYAALGISLESIEKTSVTFLGETRFAVQAVLTQSGVTFYTTQIFDFSRGSWYSCLTAVSYYENTTQEVLDMFYAVEE